jgi:DNA (cytosine-5)-methyltransferase 1
MSDVVRSVRPRFVLVENVAALLRDRDAFGWLLGDLAALGYDEEWDCVPADSVGAPHERDRLFLLAYARGERCGEGSGQLGRLGSAGCSPPLSDADGERCERRTWAGCVDAGWPEPPHGDWWVTEPDVGRVAHGVPQRVDRIRGLGNAVVPQVSEYIGRLVIAAAGEQAAA